MPISWGLAVVTATFVPTVVFWTSIMLALTDGGLGSWLMPAIAAVWLGFGLVLTRVRHGGLRGIGVGLATGAVPCLIWTTVVTVA